MGPLCLLSSKNGWIGEPPTDDRELFEWWIHDIYYLRQELRDVAQHIRRPGVFRPCSYLNIFCGVMGNLVGVPNIIYERMYLALLELDLAVVRAELNLF